MNTDTIEDRIRKSWRKTVNELFPNNGESYPASLTIFTDVEIDGVLKTFRCVIREFTEEQKKEAEKLIL